MSRRTRPFTVLDRDHSGVRRGTAVIDGPGGRCRAESVSIAYVNENAVAGLLLRVARIYMDVVLGVARAVL